MQNLIDLSNSYYSSLQNFSITVNTKFKNAINIDTIYWKETHYIDNVRQVKFFKRSENIFIKMNSNEYLIPNKSNSFHELEKRISSYAQTYKHYPYTEPKLFFKNTEASITNKSQITESDSTYSVSYLTFGIKTLEFRKTDYSIRSITEIVYDRVNKGFQTEQIIFGSAHKLSKPDVDEINNAIAIIKDPAKKAVYVKEEPPKFIDRSLIEQILKQLKNGSIESIENKIVFLDFFYQGCYPCVKSYPYINELFKNKNLNVILIGVDIVLQDSLTIEKYIEKYNLQYPILVGETAVSFERYFKFTAAPQFIIIALDGKLNYEEGFTKSSFKKFTRQLEKQ